MRMAYIHSYNQNWDSCQSSYIFGFADVWLAGVSLGGGIFEIYIFEMFLPFYIYIYIHTYIHTYIQIQKYYNISNNTDALLFSVPP